MCSLEIILPVVGCITATAVAITTASEVLPFIKKISGNGVAHSIYHLLSKKEKCKKIVEEVIVERDLAAIG